MTTATATIDFELDSYLLEPYVKPALNTSYVDLDELDECLDAYFKGTLNDVPDEYLQRLWMEPEQLIPGSVLMSILDHETMANSLWKLDVEHRMVIKAHYGRDSVAQVQLDNFSNWQGQSQLLVEAISGLANIIHELL